MSNTVKIPVTKHVELEPLNVPDTVFQHPEVPGFKGVNLPLDNLGQAAADALVKDFIERFYVQANLKSFWRLQQSR